MATALEAVDLLVRQALGEGGERRVLAEEVVAVVVAILGREGLELAVDRRRERTQQRTAGVACEQAVQSSNSSATPA